MKLLIDTHALLWYLLADPQLSGKAQTLILDPANEVLVSPASYWETAIKISVGKLNLHVPFQGLLDLCFKTYGFLILPVEPKHAAALISLPHHHKDPFDRLLVAQALVEQIPIISGDPVLERYGVTRVW